MCLPLHFHNISPKIKSLDLHTNATDSQTSMIRSQKRCMLRQTYSFCLFPKFLTPLHPTSYTTGSETTEEECLGTDAHSLAASSWNQKKPVWSKTIRFHLYFAKVADQKWSEELGNPVCTVIHQPCLKLRKLFLSQSTQKIWEKQLAVVNCHELLNQMWKSVTYR